MKCIDEEIPFEIPQSWGWARMGAIGDWGSGSTPSRGNPSYYGGHIPWLKTGELNDGIVYNTEEKITEKALKECSLRLNSIGDVLIAMYGATIGKVAIAGTPMTTNQACCGCTPIFINNEYLFYFLLASKADFIKKGEGGAQPNISREKLVSHLMPIAPLNEQGKIIRVLKHIFPNIDKYKKTQIILGELNSRIKEQLKKSVLQYAIQGKLVPQIPDDPSAVQLLEQISDEKVRLLKDGKLKKKDINNSTIYRGDDNKYYEKTGDHEMCIDEELPFDIPETWTWIRFKNLVEFSLGKTPERSNSEYWKPADIPWVSIADMNDKSILLSTKEHISAKALNEKFGAKLSPKGTLIMSFKLTIGKVSILGIDTVHNEAIISIYPYLNEENIVRDFLYNFLCIITGYTSSTDAIKGATLNSKTMGEMLIPLPPLNEQKRIIRALDNALASIMSR